MKNTNSTLRGIVMTVLVVLVAGVAVASDDGPAVTVQSLGSPDWARIEPILDTPVVRVKDIARVQGVRQNQLIGLGLVVGLEGTGDSASSLAGVQMVANMLEGFGITVSADALRIRNVAAVMVSADVGTVREGDRLDVTVSSIGDARSLQGGYLLQTPLKAANDQIYAAAQGAVSIGGFNVRGVAGAHPNHTTVAMIPNGAIIEQDIVGSITNDDSIALVLSQPDFGTAARLAAVINESYDYLGHGLLASAEDHALVRVTVPEEYRQQVVLMVAEIEQLPIRPDAPSKVVINERTGTVVMGAGVRIAPVAIAHGNLHVAVTASEPQVQEEAGPMDQIGLAGFGTEPEEVNRVNMVAGGSTVQGLVDSLNAIGASPRDVIAIFQAIKAAGALFADLTIM